MSGFKSSAVRQMEVEQGGAVKNHCGQVLVCVCVSLSVCVCVCVRASMCMSFAEARATQLTCILQQQTLKKSLISCVHRQGMWWGGIDCGYYHLSSHRSLLHHRSSDLKLTDKLQPRWWRSLAYQGTSLWRSWCRGHCCFLISTVCHDSDWVTQCV